MQYYASTMILHFHGDAAYLVLPEAHSRVTGYYFISTNPPVLLATPDPSPTGVTHNECATICNIMGLTAETEVG
eukprot:2990682-Ditylum_brightwellii.AAC.1